MALRMLQLQHRLAIVEVVSREEQIESRQIFAQHFHFRVVKLGKQWRDRLGRYYRRQSRQQSWQLRGHFGQLLDRSVRRGHARPQL